AGPGPQAPRFTSGRGMRQTSIAAPPPESMAEPSDASRPAVDELALRCAGGDGPSIRTRGRRVDQLDRFASLDLLLVERCAGRLDPGVGDARRSANGLEHGILRSPYGNGHGEISRL